MHAHSECKLPHLEHTSGPAYARWGGGACMHVHSECKLPHLEQPPQLLGAELPALLAVIVHDGLG